MNYNIQKAKSFVETILETANEKETLEKIGSLKLFPDSWAALRKQMGYLQIFLNEKQKDKKRLVVDGYYGGQTDFIFNAYLEYQKNKSVKAWRTDAKLDMSIKTQYPNYASIESFYGPLEEIQDQIVTVEIPYTHYLSWNNQKVNKISCHKKISDIYLSVLTDVLETYGEKEIHHLHLDQFGGCYVSPSRLMRGGTKYSTHCWGIAFDYDPDHNQLKWGREDAAFATPDYADWLGIWNKYDAINLGEVKNYDWMHFQFSRP